MHSLQYSVAKLFLLSNTSYAPTNIMKLNCEEEERKQWTETEAVQESFEAVGRRDG